MQKLGSVNVKGNYYVATAVARNLVQRGVGGGGGMAFIGRMSGSIVNVPQAQTLCNVSKAVVRHMTRSLAVEWAECGISVKCVSLGYVRTPL
jgi:NAD(P)-dependent dehydrogenase (short-subunit alcohol dehydrogenase family)